MFDHTKIPAIYQGWIQEPGDLTFGTVYRNHTHRITFTEGGRGGGPQLLVSGENYAFPVPDNEETFEFFLKKALVDLERKIV